MNAAFTTAASILCKPYKYLYIRMYKWYSRRWPDDWPEYNALFVLSFLIFLNILTVLAAIDVLNRQHVMALTRSTAIGMGVIIIALGYFVLIHREKYRTIAEEFGYETPSQRRRRFVASVTYVALTFLAFFWLVSLRNS
jgi:hypothetical protein